MTKNKKVTYLGMGVALYVVLSYTVKVPLINQIRTDFGYLVFGVFLCIFGMEGTIVGVLGCIISNLLYSGTFPIGWALGQLFIGILCGYIFRKTESTALRLVIALISVFIGIGVIKTLVESFLFSLPLAAKFIRGIVASIADAVPFLAGILLSKRIESKVAINNFK